jgi:hypothetical protein
VGRERAERLAELTRIDEKLKAFERLLREQTDLTVRHTHTHTHTYTHTHTHTHTYTHTHTHTYIHTHTPSLPPSVTRSLSLCLSLAGSVSSCQRTHAGLHRLVMALDAMEDAVAARTPFSRELAALRNAASDSDLDLSLVALATVTDDVAAEGVPSVADLRKRFSAVRTSVSRGAYVPPEGGMWAILASALLSTVSVKPTGYVQGDDVEGRSGRLSRVRTTCRPMHEGRVGWLLSMTLSLCACVRVSLSLGLCLWACVLLDGGVYSDPGTDRVLACAS